MSQAAAIDGALAVRDRAFRRFARFRQWLVHRHPDSPADDPSGQVETLWDKAHQLSGMLSQAGEPAAIAQAADVLADNGLGRTCASGSCRSTEAIAKDRWADWESESAPLRSPTTKSSRQPRSGIGWSASAFTTWRSPGPHCPSPRPPNLPIPIGDRTRAHRESKGPVWRLSARNWFGQLIFKDQDQGDYRSTLEHLRGLRDAGPWWREAVREGTGSASASCAWRAKVDVLADEGRDRRLRGVQVAPVGGRWPRPDGRSRGVPGRLGRRAVVAIPAKAEPTISCSGWPIGPGPTTWYGEDPAAPPYYQAIVAVVQRRPGTVSGASRGRSEDPRATRCAEPTDSRRAQHAWS